MAERDNMSLSFALKERKTAHPTDTRKESLFAMVDTDGSGTIDKQEFNQLYEAVKKDLKEEQAKEQELEEQATRAKRRMKTFAAITVFLAVFLGISIVANAAIMLRVVDEGVKTTVESGTSALEVKNTGGMIAATSEAQQQIPLLVAPALDHATLGKVKFMSVSRTSMQWSSELQDVVTGLVVTGYDWVSKLQMVFHTSNGYDLFIDHGLAKLVHPGKNTTELVCSANTTCSSFTVEGVDVDAKYEEVRGLLKEVVDNVPAESPWNVPDRRHLEESRMLSTLDHGRRLWGCRRELFEDEDRANQRHLSWCCCGTWVCCCNYYYNYWLG